MSETYTVVLLVEQALSTATGRPAPAARSAYPSSTCSSTSFDEQAGSGEVVTGL